jgi:PAS domain S-box-containing protein
MRRSRPRPSNRPNVRPSSWTLIGGGVAGLVLAASLALAITGRSTLAFLILSGLLSAGAGLAIGAAWERSRWSSPVRALARNLAAFNDDPGESWDLPGSPPLAELVAPVKELQGRFLSLRGRLDASRDDLTAGSDSGEMGVIGPLSARMTRSGNFEPPILDEPTMPTGEFSALDMINRLDPRSLRWLDSSLSEQLFLGWSLDQLKEKSFLDIVRVDDRRLAKQQFRAVLERGEGLADITAKLRDESELKRRTLELTQANDDLRRANRKLERLKDRYSDLYENAPAMYFTVDRKGRFQECNGTLVRALGYTRKELLGQPVARLVPEGRRSPLADRLAEDLRPGPIEVESEWAKSDGEIIAIWVTGSAIPDADGRVRQVRCVAQDVTARRRLEAELKLKNERLAVANAELSSKNKELDEFTHVVSHDIQEPIRTLIAFSDFLMRDQAEKLDESGREYVRLLSEASRRLRSLIQDLLSLSRAGKVTTDFREVRLDEVIEVLRADLAALVRSKGAEIRVEGPLPTAWGDRDRIGQLLANLVANGLKYNRDPHPRVEIRATTGGPGRGVTLSVVDNGIGIEPRFHDKIFRLFRRLHTREEYEGTGAGLAICQKIVQAHCGRIWVESEPGRGSTFSFTLPAPPEGREATRPEILKA